MPYCPKCDMEFIDGITTCTDCGGPLVESEEAYKKEMQKKMERAYQQRAAQAQKFYQADNLMQREMPLSQAEEGAVRTPDSFSIPVMDLNFGAPEPERDPVLTPAQIIQETISKKEWKKQTPKSFTKEERLLLRAAAADQYAAFLRREEAKRLLGTYSRGPAQPRPASDAVRMPSDHGVAFHRGMMPNDAPVLSQQADPAQEDPSGQRRGEEAPARQSRAPQVSNLYVSASQKMEDRRSSSIAFLFVGGVIFAFSVLCWCGIVKLPMSGFSRSFTQGILTAMGLVFLGVSFKAHTSIKELDGQAEAEQTRNQELIRWFTDNWSGEELDHAIQSAESGLEQQEIELRRYALIQYRVVKEKQLTDQAYVDFIVEEIYNALYPENEA